MPSTLEREPFKTTWVKRWKSIDCLGGLGEVTATENAAQGMRTKNAQQVKNCCFHVPALRGGGTVAYFFSGFRAGLAVGLLKAFGSNPGCCCNQSFTSQASPSARICRNSAKVFSS